MDPAPSVSYQILLLGSKDPRSDAIRECICDRVADLGVDARVVAFFDETSAATRDIRLPVMAIFLGSSSAVVDVPLIDQLIADSIVIAPVVSLLSHVASEVPLRLRHINALELGAGDAGLARVASLVLETFRLLRRERRLFISYKRDDAQPFAEKLYESLDTRGFDVFIDVRSVPPAVDFQSELWHRMSDSDVVVLVDTPGFRASRWTTAELAQANATNIQILHLLWPGQKEDALSSFSHFFKLKRSDFWAWRPGKGRYVTNSAISRICAEAERLRARAIAARHRYLVDNFCDAARDLGMSPAVQPERWISIPRPGGRTLAAVPAVGVPTSDRMKAIFDAISDTTTNSRDLWVIYDNRGILSTWLAHLDWLDAHLPIRAVRVSNAPDALKALLP